MTCRSDCGLDPLCISSCMLHQSLEVVGTAHCPFARRYISAPHPHHPIVCLSAQNLFDIPPRGPDELYKRLWDGSTLLVHNICTLHRSISLRAPITQECREKALNFRSLSRELKLVGKHERSGKPAVFYCIKWFPWMDECRRARTTKDV
jgi:hypothetical protein